MKEYLQTGNFVDTTHPAVRAFSAEHARGADDREKAVSLYYAVRDRIRYNPFQNFLADESYRGSACLERRIAGASPRRRAGGLRRARRKSGARRFRRRRRTTYHAGAHGEDGQRPLRLTATPSCISTASG